jgi:hypothetical protein
MVALAKAPAQHIAHRRAADRKCFIRTFDIVFVFYFPPIASLHWGLFIFNLSG